MIKQFIFAKLSEKFFKKVMQGDRKGIVKYFKMALVAIVVMVLFIIIGIILFIQFIFGFFAHVGNQAESVRNINETKIEESIKKAKQKMPEEVSTTVEQVKAKIAPYDTLLKEAESIILKTTETVRYFEKLVP
jgi:predicted PurR-regulated permease PerM